MDDEAAAPEIPAPSRVLVIEDEPESRDFMREGLTRAGWRVAVSDDGVAGLHLATTGDFDVIVVDRMLPGLDGLSLVQALREAGRQTPVLFLTAMGALSDRVAGLKGGGDDYLVKPFYMDELEARLHALARRSAAQPQRTRLQARDLVMDRLTQKVERAGRGIDLQPLEYKLLEYLLLNAGETVTRAMLLERVWGFRFDPRTNIVETHISRLRAKLDAEGGEALISTVRGAGYVIRS